MAAGVPRILMLPGYTQNAAIFNGKLGAIRRALKDSVELVFVDPPHVVDLPTNSSNDFDSTASAQPTTPEETPRAWWFAESKEGFRHFTKMDESIVYLREILETKGPFDGVFGFSQGAACAAILTALVENPSLHPAFTAPAKPDTPSNIWPPPQFKFAVLSAGFMPMDPLWSRVFTPALKTPSLHVLGRGDTIVGTDRSLPLLNGFVNPRLEWHEGGHHTPSKASWRKFFVQYLGLFGPDGPGAAGIPDIPSPAGSQAVEEGGKL